jgi:Domain of unknown function (DUF1707)
MAMRENSPFPGLPGQEGGPGYAPPRCPPARYALAPHAMRIGDAERNVAAQELGEHFVAGRLTLDELHERLGLVLSARTHGQLARVMADLPAPCQLLPRRAGAGNPASPAAPAAPAAPVPALAGRAHREEAPGDNAGQLAAVALLLFAMLIWLFTVMMFAGFG